MPNCPQIVFIDGIGGRRYMRGALLKALSTHGYPTHHFAYSTANETLNGIQQRLSALLSQLAEQGDYVLIGYSFGGVLARRLLCDPAFSSKAPLRLLLLASPIHASQLSQRFADWSAYKMLTGECGQLVASATAMAAIGLPAIPIHCIYGTWGKLGPLALFATGKQRHDGMLSENEIAPGIFHSALAIHASHAFIPSHQRAIAGILECLQQDLAQ